MSTHPGLELALRVSRAEKVCRQCRERYAQGGSEWWSGFCLPCSEPWIQTTS